MFYDDVLQVTFQKDLLQLELIQKRFDSGFKVVDKSRRFIREGELVKVCHNNKRKKYQFFLFSDMLVYASTSIFGKLHAQSKISLRSIKVSDVRESTIRHAFRIQVIRRYHS